MTEKSSKTVKPKRQRKVRGALAPEHLEPVHPFGVFLRIAEDLETLHGMLGLCSKMAAHFSHVVPDLVGQLEAAQAVLAQEAPRIGNRQAVQAKLVEIAELMARIEQPRALSDLVNLGLDAPKPAALQPPAVATPTAQVDGDSQQRRARAPRRKSGSPQQRLSRSRNTEPDDVIH